MSKLVQREVRGMKDEPFEGPLRRTQRCVCDLHLNFEAEFRIAEEKRMTSWSPDGEGDNGYNLEQRPTRAWATFQE